MGNLQATGEEEVHPKITAHLGVACRTMMSGSNGLLIRKEAVLLTKRRVSLYIR
jgi:hypothetical protein